MSLPRNLVRARARTRDEQQRRAMASLLVNALGLGSGKQEDSVAAEVFAAFGLDLAGLDRSIPQRTRDRARVLRELAATELGTAAWSTGAIVAELARASGLLVAMAQEVYQLLAERAATTTGTTEDFRIAASDLDSVDLTISPAFLEDVTSLVRESVVVMVASLDQDGLRRFLGLDMGVPHGHWPRDTMGAVGFPLPSAVLQVVGVLSHLEALCSTDAQWTGPAQQARRAHAAAERLVDAAEQVVTGFADHLTHLAGGAPQGVPITEYVAQQAYHPVPGSYLGAVQASQEVNRFLDSGHLGSTVWLTNADGRRVAHEIAMSLSEPGGNEPRIRPTEDDHPASVVAGLASWCVMFRADLDPDRRGQQLRHQLSTPQAWSTWLEQLTSACEEASSWFVAMGDDLHREVSGQRVREDVERLLNLPLWRNRDLLYEVWLLVATLRACEQAGADVELTGLDPHSRAWVLPASRAGSPVAEVVFRPGEQRLNVWREPVRTAADGGVLTPDVTISVPGSTPRDLVVVEAKDRIKMAEAAAVRVARKYADGLAPRLTWVGNHCEFRLGRDLDDGQESPAVRNFGDPWHPIHLAGRLRPGSVPPAFAETIAAAIRPLGATGS